MRGFIFDLDGTLIDSMPVWDNVCVQYLKNNGIPIPADIKHVIRNMSFQQSEEYFIRRFNLPFGNGQVIEQWNGMVREAYAKSIPLKEGAREFITKNRDKKMAIATASDRELVELILERFGLRQYFSVILTAAEAGCGKDNPRFYFECARMLGLEIPDCVVFEDALYAIETAKNAGFMVVALFDGYSSCDAERIKAVADRYIMSFCELATIDL